MKKLLLGFIFGLTTACAGAQEFWIWRATTADLIRMDLANAAALAVEYRRNTAAFETAIEKARRNYFEASFFGKDRAAEEFSKLLFAKDVMLASFIIPNGFSQHSEALGKLFAGLNNGRQIDGGIRGLAYGPFQEWVVSLRHSLGARGDYDTILVTAPQLQQALIANAQAYVKYQQIRDVAEVNIWKSAHPRPDEIPGKRPFSKSLVRDLVSNGAETWLQETGYGRALVEAQKAGARRISCEYGPSYDAGGGKVFGSADFWKDKPPSNMAVLVALKRGGGMQYTDHAVSSCPKNEAEALKILRRPISTAITAEAQEKASAENEKDKSVALEHTRKQEAQAAVMKEYAERRRVEDEKFYAAQREKQRAEFAKWVADRPAREAREAAEYKERLKWPIDKKLAWNAECARKRDADFRAGGYAAANARMTFDGCAIPIH